MVRSSIVFLVFIISCNAQTDQVPNVLSEDFDASFPFSYGMPSQLSASDTSRGWYLEKDQILLTGTVYKPDGTTPTSNVIMYYYQTNSAGKYEHKTNEVISMPPNKLGQTHGYIRGWVKTDREGKYAIYTSMPGSYPNRNDPAHVHLYVKEEGREHYYLDNFVFDNDMLLSSSKRKRMENRGGSGVIRFVKKDGLLVGERDIYLGLNIPDYNKEEPINIVTESGLAIGEDVFSFTPYHAWGADMNTRTCPICKYGWYNGVLYFVGNNPNWDEVSEWLIFLEEESVKRKNYLKVYFVYGNEKEFSHKMVNQKLKEIGEELAIEKTALTFVPSFSDTASDVYLNQINPNVENTFIIYRRVKIIDKFINLQPSKEHFSLISESLNKSKNAYFDLPKANQN